MKRRVSIDRDDREAYLRWIGLGGGSSRWDIYLDGVRVDKCTTADPDEGYVVAYALDEQGVPIVHPSREFCIKETRHGRVQVFCDGVEV